MTELSNNSRGEINYENIKSALLTKYNPETTQKLITVFQSINGETQYTTSLLKNKAQDLATIIFDAKSIEVGMANYFNERNKNILDVYKVATEQYALEVLKRLDKIVQRNKTNAYFTSTDESAGSLYWAYMVLKNFKKLEAGKPDTGYYSDESGESSIVPGNGFGLHGKTSSQAEVKFELPINTGNGFSNNDSFASMPSDQ